MRACNLNMWVVGGGGGFSPSYFYRCGAELPTFSEMYITVVHKTLNVQLENSQQVSYYSLKCLYKC